MKPNQRPVVQPLSPSLVKLQSRLWVIWSPKTGTIFVYSAKLYPSSWAYFLMVQKRPTQKAAWNPLWPSFNHTPTRLPATAPKINQFYHTDKFDVRKKKCASILLSCIFLTSQPTVPSIVYSSDIGSGVSDSRVRCEHCRKWKNEVSASIQRLQNTTRVRIHPVID